VSVCNSVLRLTRDLDGCIPRTILNRESQTLGNIPKTPKGWSMATGSPKKIRHGSLVFATLEVKP
jgi:hypothetical protein